MKEDFLFEGMHFFVILRKITSSHIIVYQAETEYVRSVLPELIENIKSYMHLWEINSTHVHYYFTFRRGYIALPLEILPGLQRCEEVIAHICMQEQQLAHESAEGHPWTFRFPESLYWIWRGALCISDTNTRFQQWIKPRAHFIDKHDCVIMLKFCFCFYAVIVNLTY